MARNTSEGDTNHYWPCNTTYDLIQESRRLCAYIYYSLQLAQETEPQYIVASSQLIYQNRQTFKILCRSR